MPKTIDREEESRREARDRELALELLREAEGPFPGTNPTTGQAGLRDLPFWWAGFTKIQAADLDTAIVAGTNLTANQQTRRENRQIGTIATTGATEFLFRALNSGTLAAISLTSKDALVAHDSNYITFTLTNKASGAGTTVMLTASDLNTTKLTGGVAFVAYTPHVLQVNAANAAVAGGDVLALGISVTGTLANTLTETIATLTFTTT